MFEIWKMFDHQVPPTIQNSIFPIVDDVQFFIKPEQNGVSDPDFGTSSLVTIVVSFKQIPLMVIEFIQSYQEMNYLDENNTDRLDSRITQITIKSKDFSKLHTWSKHQFKINKKQKLEVDAEMKECSLTTMNSRMFDRYTLFDHYTHSVNQEFHDFLLNIHGGDFVRKTIEFICNFITITSQEYFEKEIKKYNQLEKDLYKVASIKWF